MKSTRARGVDRYIIAIDIVGYSELPDADAQLTAIQRLVTAVKKCSALPSTSNRVHLPTGDGMFIGFSTDAGVAAPLEFAKQLHKKYGDDRRTLKIAIWKGVVVQYSDINDRPNYAGKGINFAARLESCCSGGHILVDDTIATDLLATSQSYKPYLSELLEFDVKAQRGIRARNYTGPDFGNANPPIRNRHPEKETFAAEPVKLTRRSKRTPALSPAELMEIADRSGVKDLYLRLTQGLDPLLKKNTNRSGLTYAATVDYRTIAVLNIKPDESSAEKGVRYQAYFRRLARAFHTTEIEVRAVLPPGHEPWSLVATDPDFQGCAGFFRTAEQIDSFTEFLRGRCKK